MNAADNFNAAESSGFIVAMAPAVARRQLKISIAVLSAFIAASLLVLATGALQAPSQKPASVKLTIQLPSTISMHQAKASTIAGAAAKRDI